MKITKRFKIGSYILAICSLYAFYVFIKNLRVGEAYYFPFIMGTIQLIPLVFIWIISGEKEYNHKEELIWN